MKIDDYRKIGMGIAFLLLFAWPLAYLANRMEVGGGRLAAAVHGAGMPSHAGYRMPRVDACPSPTPLNKSFRMGIDMDQSPFAR